MTRYRTTMDTTKKITTIDGVRVAYEPKTLSKVRAAWLASDEGGTIQAWDMVRLTSDPKMHAATSLTSYLRTLGAEIID